MATIGNLVVKLSASTKQFTTAMSRAESRMSAFAGTVARFGGAAVVAGATGLAALTRRQLKLADETAKVASRLGTTTEFLSEMGFVAERSGVSTQSLNTGLQRMQRRLSEAATTGKGVSDALDEMNLSATDLAGLSLEDQFNAVAKGLASIENPADRTRLAFRLFDTEGVGLLQTLEGGIENIANLRGEAQALGVTMSGDAVKGAVEFSGAVTNLNAALSGLANSLIVEVGPGLTDFVSFLADTLPSVITIVKELFTLVGKFVGGNLAFLTELAQGNFSAAFDIGKNVFSDVGQSAARIGEAGQDLFGEKQVEEQQTTNEILQQIAKSVAKGNVAVAG